MNIIVNGENRELSERYSLEEALEMFAKQSPFVVMLNQEFIPKSQYSQWGLNEGDELDIIVAIQGG
ncbi:sulfur carrier protein ThiS [Thiomicrorhabdus sp. 6S2-11]|uniref:Sulfur carrier protein ThiS n=1 Tax=Thiomicrorhabdus marina TaxID=2818442 RepID=A0ABS3Q2Y8_9GAMM|nr:sulfur carrier protein ThiS [Thiomicrorhabdus marina]MBO1926698.1 sulfur carrier protein ThiS [Thiomicrorhabdus marina]